MANPFSGFSAFVKEIIRFKNHSGACNHPVPECIILLFSSFKVSWHIGLAFQVSVHC